MSEQEARAEALRLANTLAYMESLEDTVARAERYFTFLTSQRPAAPARDYILSRWLRGAD